jgi:hypothetical protein
MGGGVLVVVLVGGGLVGVVVVWLGVGCGSC